MCGMFSEVAPKLIPRLGYWWRPSMGEKYSFWKLRKGEIHQRYLKKTSVITSNRILRVLNQKETTGSEPVTQVKQQLITDTWWEQWRKNLKHDEQPPNSRVTVHCSKEMGRNKYRGHSARGAHGQWPFHCVLSFYMSVFIWVAAASYILINISGLLNSLSLFFFLHLCHNM